MKKNKMMRTASVLLVLTLLTVCVISGTFAKYTTTANGTDTARVAKFGVNITANGATFAQSYAKDDEAYTISNATVVSGTQGEKVVAPGTKGEMAKMTLTGTPEVAVRVSYEGTFELDDNWTGANRQFYCPLQIKVGDTTINGATATSKTDLETKVNNAIKAYSKDYAAGTDLSSVGDGSLAISWEWPYSVDDTSDTILGNATTPAHITLAVQTRVTQID